MKTLLFILSLAFSIISVSAQQTLTKSFTHNGTTRSYILYVPANYSTTTAVPLLLNFHGYTSNASQ